MEPTSWQDAFVIVGVVWACAYGFRSMFKAMAGGYDSNNREDN